MPTAHETVIRPTNGWINVDLAALWRYRDLVWVLVNRDFVARYKQTVLGPLWFVIQPLLTTLVFAIVFGGIAAIPTDGVPPFLFYLTALLGWNFFSTTLTSASNTLAANVGIFGKVYFPRLVVPIATVLSGFIALGVQLATYLPVWAWYRFCTPAGESMPAVWTVLLLPAVIAQIALLAFGSGLWLSALTAKYRDFAFVSGFFVQLWMYATPVIFPLSSVPARWRWLVAINPMTVPVEAIKAIFLGHGAVQPAHVALSLVITALIVCGGLAVFGKIERTFVDTV